MIISTAISVNDIVIRLTDERLYHITHNHPELAGQTFEIVETVAKPEFVARGRLGELYAARKLNHRYLVVVYKESGSDGFIITAFITSKVSYVKKREIVWPK